MSEFKPGDRVRVTLEGVVRMTYAHDGCLLVGDHYVFPEKHGFKSLEKLSPPEPPNGSVVLTVNGKAWQRKYHSWYSTAELTLTWKALNAACGPLTLIHRADEK